MSYFDRFYRVKTQGDVLTKTAAEYTGVADVDRKVLYRPAAFRDAVVAAKTEFWTEVKTAAEIDEDGLVLGLAKIARDIWTDAHRSGVKTAAVEDDALPFIASFACAGVVDATIAAMVKRAELTPSEGAKLATLNALAAFDDLEKVAFGVADLMNLVRQHPQIAGMVTGAAVGAAVGALDDEESPLRGATAGASLGAAVGATAGHAMGGVGPSAGGLPSNAGPAWQSGGMTGMAQRILRRV